MPTLRNRNKKLLSDLQEAFGNSSNLWDRDQ
jgi:hypothetical protein